MSVCPCDRPTLSRKQKERRESERRVKRGKRDKLAKARHMRNGNLLRAWLTI